MLLPLKNGEIAVEKHGKKGVKGVLSNCNCSIFPIWEICCLRYATILP